MAVCYLKEQEEEKYLKNKSSSQQHPMMTQSKENYSHI